jgi:hypothetical protein
MTAPHKQAQTDQFFITYQEIMHQIMARENAFFFFQPVDPVADGAPDYFQYVTKPMSIFAVQEKLDKRQYECPSEFVADMRQIWTNAKIYNQQTHAIYKAADALAARFEILAATLPHDVSESQNKNGLQWLVESRFARYRSAKSSHQ